MKIVSNGTKVRKVEVDCNTQLIYIMYEKGVQVDTIMLTFNQAEELKFVNFERLAKII